MILRGSRLRGMGIRVRRTEDLTSNPLESRAGVQLNLEITRFVCQKPPPPVHSAPAAPPAAETCRPGAESGAPAPPTSQSARGGPTDCTRGAGRCSAGLSGVHSNREKRVCSGQWHQWRGQRIVSSHRIASHRISSHLIASEVEHHLSIQPTIQPSKERRNEGTIAMKERRGEERSD